MKNATPLEHEGWDTYFHKLKVIIIVYYTNTNAHSIIVYASMFPDNDTYI